MTMLDADKIEILREVAQGFGSVPNKLMIVVDMMRDGQPRIAETTLDQAINHLTEVTKKLKDMR